MNIQTNLRSRLLSGTCAALCFAAPSIAAAPFQNQAKNPDASDLDRLATDVISASFGLSARDGELIGMGRDYQADFDAGSMIFTPALGAAADRTLPLSFSLLDIRRGEQALLQADRARTARQASDTMVIYDRAGGIQERYEVRPEGVHQTFLFPDRPAGHGDLVVRGRIATELEVEQDGAGLLFERDGLGGVSWGGVTGIDALGASTPGSVHLSGDVIELVLPAAFVDQATYPLLLDPLIGSVLDTNITGENDFYPDVAFDASEDRYLAVWHRTFSVEQSAIRGQLFSRTGTPIGLTIGISEQIPPGGRISLRPGVANVNDSDRFLVAWQERIGLMAAFNIKTAAVNAADGAVSSVLKIGFSASHQRNVAVGGERMAGYDGALVVWEQDNTGIRVQPMTVPPAGDISTAGLTSILELNAGSIEHRYPAISKSAGTSGNSCVVWERVDTAGGATASGTGRIVGEIVKRDGSFPGMAVDISDPTDTRSNNRPAVDGDGQQWVIAWQRQEIFVPTKYDIMTRAAVRRNSMLSFDWGQQYLESDFDDNEHSASVAWTGTRAVVGFVDDTVTDSNVFLAGVDPYTGKLGEAPMEALTVPGSVLHTSAASGWAAGAAGPGADDALVVFHHKPNVSPDGDILSIRYDTPNEPTNIGGGVKGGGVNVNPMLHAGNSNFYAQLRSSRRNALVAFVVAGSTDPFACGLGTWYPSLGPGLILVPRLTDANGNAFAQLPIPPTALGAQIYTQWATKSPTSQCPVIGGVNFSNALMATIQP